MKVAFLTCRRGAAAVEAALVLPILLCTGLAAGDAAYLLSESHRMKAGLAAGARYMSKARDPVAMEAAAVNVAVTGRRDGSGTPRVKGWRTQDVTVSYRMVANTTGAYTGPEQLRIVRLQSQRAYQGFGLLRLVGLGAIQVQAAHEERWTGS